MCVIQFGIPAVITRLKKIQLDNSQSQLFFKQSVNENEKYIFDMSVISAVSNSSVTSATLTERLGDATITGESLSSNVKAAFILFQYSGEYIIDLKATLADGQIYVWYLNFDVQ